jgi:Cu/Ag efflux protein CusF
MKSWLSVGLVSVAMIGAAAFSPIFAADPAPNAADPGSAQQAPSTGDQGGAMQSPGTSQGQKLSAVEVTNIDKANGTVEIKKIEGGQETIKLDESAKAQLDKIQKGDKVDIEVVDRNGEKIAKSVMKAG